MTKYYLSNNERKAQGSDYAKSQGLGEHIGYNNYWLRSSYAHKSFSINYFANVVGNDGNVYFYLVNVTCYGVRVACNINL